MIKILILSVIFFAGITSGCGKPTTTETVELESTGDYIYCTDSQNRIVLIYGTTDPAQCNQCGGTTK